MSSSRKGRRESPDALTEAVRAGMGRLGLAPGTTVVVGYSGGPDSTALLHALVELAPELALNLVPAHLDHATRESSEMDATYCRRVAKRLGLAMLAERLVEPPRDELGLRELRYRFFAEQASMVGAAAVATGHTLDDQAETVLLNLLRGSGSAGLSAMAPSVEHHGVRVVRPMLGASRADVLDFLDRRKLRFLEDPTNREPIHDRNRVRLEVMPLLESIRPGAARALARSAGLLADESSYLEGRARAAQRRRGGANLHELPRAVARLAVRELLRATLGDLARVSQAVVDEALAISRASASDGERRHVALPGPWVLQVERGGLQVVPGSRGRPSIPEGLSEPPKPSRRRRKPIS